MQISKEKIKEELKGYLIMVLGCALYALGVRLFLDPNKIIAGGISGLAILINDVIDLEKNIDIVGTMIIVINVPIFLIALKTQGWKFVVRGAVTVLTLGVITDLFETLPSLTDDGVLASLYGGIFQGVAIGIFLKYEFSSGGTELLGRILAGWIKKLKIPLCVGILDGLIVIIGSIVTQNPSNMLHALIVIFVVTKLSEMILVGLEKSKLCIIISDKGEEIAKTLIERSPRGVTMLEGEGMYTHTHRNVLLTCVKNPQLSQLKYIVKSIDPKAFIIINDSAEVRGQGFQSLE